MTQAKTIEKVIEAMADTAFTGTTGQLGAEWFTRRSWLEIMRAAFFAQHGIVWVLPVEATEVHQEALRKIAGGFINSACFMKLPPDWHSAFNQLQAIAREALVAAGAAGDLTEGGGGHGGC